MDYLENNTKIFKLKQDEKDYILSLSIIGEFIRISGQENIGKTGNFYETNFTLKDLCKIHRYFLIMHSIKEAYDELVKAIEKQKVGIELTLQELKIIFYMTIGTDDIVFKLPLGKTDNADKRIINPEEQKPFDGNIHLRNRGYYPRDEQRISNLEQNNKVLKESQNDLIVEIKKLLDVSEKLRKETNLLYEENAKLKIRVQQIQKENLETNLQVDALKEEEQAINDENIKLKIYIEDLEKVLVLKKENLKKNYEENIKKNKNKEEIDVGNGPKAISSRYDQAKVKTYIPRATAKPILDAYQEGLLTNARPPFYYTEKRITQYLTNTFPVNEQLNYTDMNIQNNNTNNNSFRNYNDNDINNISYNTYNKAVDYGKVYESDGFNYFSDTNIREPENNFKKHKKKANKQGYVRISEKTNEYEEDNQNYKASYLINRESNSRPSEITEEMKVIKSQIIRSTTEEEMLLNKINKPGFQISFKLIYKAVKDTDRAEIFHQKCDKAQRTLVLVETIDNKRFGGYTSQSWEGLGIEKSDSEAFIFSLNKMQIYNIISGQPAIGCYPKYGPVFLGCQIKINDNFFVKGGTTFKKNTNYATLNDFELNDGEKFYGIKDVEVFEVNLI